jgi:pimeloyl-ACP methyl ester carboxylesterase
VAVVLVHGSFVDSSAWEGVAGALRDGGTAVELVDLHRGSLAADTAAVQEVVDAVGGPVVLCGWSYGGMPITGTTLPAGSHLVYLCALVPDEGDSAVSLGTRHPTPFNDLVAELGPGELVLTGDDLGAVLWGDAPPAEAGKALASLRTQSLASYMDTPTHIGWRSTPSTLVIGRQDRVLHRSLFDELAPRVDTVVEWDTSHSPMLSRPDLVVDLLRELDPA